MPQLGVQTRSDTDRFTETLGRLRVKEIMNRQPGELILRVVDATGERDVRLGGRISAGAHADNNLVLRDDPAISNVHFELAVEGEVAKLRDLGSKNGTWIGSGARVREVDIRPGCTFTVGSSKITLLGIGSVDVPVSTVGRFGDLHARGTAMGVVFSLLDRLAQIPIDVLVTGETGTGKELVATGLHAHSPQSAGPFVVLDCAALNESTAEGELFGHARGAFTGAQADKAGLLEGASGGTLFIDEVGELPRSLQQKLLRALGERKTRRLGESQYRKFEARVVAATNRDLLQMVGDGGFREDLYFRIAQATVQVPALRDRGIGDIHALADLFVDRVARDRNKPMRMSSDVYDLIGRYRWPGNVRELQSVIRYAAFVAEGDEVSIENLPPLKLDEGATGAQATHSVSPRAIKLQDALFRPFAEARLAFERIYVERVLAETGGNKSEAARRLGMSRSTLRDLLGRVGLPRP